ncbi:hypothetical protein WICPIJ_002254 [Wickerhamomyces pijperi]|uniref:Uncharacterized protein n=1 Tax=Wickerhamomyces pijperi TaxID=599730 RepID=A0A9P8QBU3_WICPI|nr:hypothetical protein WICPIJ_002254 [Wickerhamomyces pijperi]
METSAAVLTLSSSSSAKPKDILDKSESVKPGNNSGKCSLTARYKSKVTASETTEKFKPNLLIALANLVSETTKVVFFSALTSFKSFSNCGETLPSMTELISSKALAAELNLEKAEILNWFKTFSDVFKSVIKELDL